MKLLACLLAMLGNHAVHAAAAPPDSGQTLRALEQAIVVPEPVTVAPLRVEEMLGRADSADATRFPINSIHVSGSSVFATDRLEALVAYLEGGEHSLDELYQGVERITAYYRERGFVIARAYLPVQDVINGEVRIEVMEGRIGQQHIDNKSRLSDAQVNAYLSAIKTGEALHAQTVERALLLLNDIPGTGSALATLQPGASVGTADLIIDLSPSAAYTGRLELDNFGNRYTGDYRLGGTIALNSPLGIGDRIALQGLHSNEDLSYVRLSYQLPAGNRGFSLGAAYFDTRYRLGKEFSALQAHGTASSRSLFALYPLLRAPGRDLYASLVLEDKELEDHTGTPVTASNRTINLASFGITGQYQDALGGGGITSFDLTVVEGNLKLDPEALAVDQLALRSNGSFSRFSYSIERTQRLSARNSLLVSLGGQQAGKNLGSSEKFALGGSYGVRAYPAGEGIGDEGWVMNLELQHNFHPQVQGVLFYDQGSVKVNRKPIAGSNNKRRISGAGLGLTGRFADVAIDAFVAWHRKRDEVLSEASSANDNPRFWIKIYKQF